jgi:hypothetical protein
MVARARSRSDASWYLLGVSGISDEELAKALAENIDAEGNDVGLRAWVALWSPEQRARSRENLRAWASAARREMKVGGDQRED